jgi:hypothetical protein
MAVVPPVTIDVTIQAMAGADEDPKALAGASHFSVRASQ